MARPLVRRLAVVAVTLLAPTALAQVNQVQHGDPSRGVTWLAGGVALAEDSSAPAWNPAGLAKVRGAELLYAHERSVVRDVLGDAIAVGLSPFDGLALGLSLDWMRDGNGQNPFRRTNVSLAFGSDLVTVGVGLNHFTGGARDALTSIDLGVQLTPFRFLAFGASLRNVDAPERGGLRMARQVTFGVGLRPFRERLTAGVDFTFDDQTGISGSRLSYVLKGEVIRGLWLTAAFSHGVDGVAPAFAQAGLQLDLAHVGAGYGFSYSQAGVGHLVTARLSTEAHHALPVARDQIAVISMDDVGANSGGTSVASLLGVSSPDRYLRLVRALEAARRDDALAGVVLKVETSGVGLGRALELRQAVLALRLAGKKVVALILSATDADYLYASAADQLYAVPEAMLMIDGLQASTLFLGDAAERLGVKVDVARVGAYKNAPDQFTRGSMSQEQKEAVNAYLDTNTRVLATAAQESRKLAAEPWQQALDLGLKSVKKAKALGLIDDVVPSTELEGKLDALLPGTRVTQRYSPFGERQGRWGSRAKIAIVPVLGTISGGGDGGDPLGMVTTAGAETFVKTLDAAVSDPDVKAIVIRVDSPGGDGLASDLMYRAVLEAKKRKPVIASMGDVAASGGYYVAMGAEQIFAQPTTITGSIGVFVVKPGFAPLAEKLSIRQETIKRGALSGALDVFEPWSEAQRASVQAWVDDFYDTFITEVAASRKRPKEQIDQVARGRVWSGADAQTKGLVDTLGGLVDAIEAARTRANVTWEQADIVIMGQGGGVLGRLLGASAIETLEATPAPGSPSPQAMKLLSTLAPAMPWLDGRIQARLEVDLTVQ